MTNARGKWLDRMKEWMRSLKPQVCRRDGGCFEGNPKLAALMRASPAEQARTFWSEVCAKPAMLGNQACRVAPGRRNDMRTQTHQVPQAPSLTERLMAARAARGSRLEALRRAGQSKSTDLRLEVARDRTVNVHGVPAAPRLIRRS